MGFYGTCYKMMHLLKANPGAKEERITDIITVQCRALFSLETLCTARACNAVAVGSQELEVSRIFIPSRIDKIADGFKGSSIKVIPMHIHEDCKAERWCEKAVSNTFGCFTYASPSA